MKNLTIITYIIIYCIFSITDITFAYTLADQEEKSPVRITADEIETVKNDNVVKGRGAVIVNYKDYTVKAEEILFNTETGEGTASDRVNIYDKSSESSINCTKTDFNIKDKKGTIYNGDGDIKGEYFFSGERIERIDEDKYIIHNGSLTTCKKDGKPSWEFRVKKGYVQIEHYAYLHHPTFRIGGVPVLYLPYLIVPVKTKRASGVLMPYIGNSSKDGYFINNALFWAINEQSDATLYLDYMTKKGVRPKVEYRYTPSRNTKGEFNASYLQEADTRREFWKISLDHSQRLFYDIANITVLDIAGANNIDQEFEDTEELRTKRKADSYTWFTKSWDNNSLKLTARYRKSVEHNVDEKFYELPDISYIRQQSQIGDSPIFFNMASSYTFFGNEAGDQRAYIHRFNINPVLSAPFNRLPYLTLTPKLGLIDTLYSMGKDRDGGVVRGGFSRESYYINTEVEGPKISKILRDSEGTPFLKHLIIPVVEHAYTPDIDKKDRDKIWFNADTGRIGFDSIDDIPPKNIVTYSLFNRVLKKEAEQVSEIFKFELRNSYDIRKGTGKDRTPGTALRPFSNIRGDMDSNIIPGLVLNADSEYNIYDKRLDNANGEAALNINIWDIKLKRRYSRGEDISWIGSLGINIYSNLALRFSARFNESSNRFIENAYGFKYSAGCWDISLDLMNRKVIIDGSAQDEFKVYVLVTLKGIGTFGREKEKEEVF